MAVTIAGASVKVINNGTSTTGTVNTTLSASGNDRILVIAFVYKDNSATAAVPSAIVVDSAGVNSTLANGKVVQQGSLQLAQEGDFSSTCDVYFCLEANLPVSAGSYAVDTTLDSAPQYHMVQIFEIAGCPSQAYDAIVQNLSTANVSAATKFSDSITPTVNDCLIVDIWATSHSSAPTFTSTETQLATISNTNGASVTSQFLQTTAAAKTMEQESSTLHQRRAWTLLSFSPTAAGTEILANTDALLLTENAATVNATTNISANVHALLLTENPASVSLNVNIISSTHTLILTENIATVNAETSINATTQALILSENAATVNAENNISTNVHNLLLTEYQASTSAGTVISALTDNLILTENQSIVNAENNVNTNVHALALTEFNSNVNAETSIVSNTDVLLITTYGATITLPSGGTNVNANVHNLFLVENTASINASNNVQTNLHELIITTNVVSITTGLAPTSEGLQYTISGRKLHYTFNDEKVHYTMKA